MATISSNEIHVKYVLDTGQLQAATQAMSQITAEERKLLADLKKLQDQLNATGKVGSKAGDDVADSFGNVGEVVKGLLPVFGVAFAVDKIKQFASYAFQVSMQFEQMSKTMAFVSGSTAKANEQFSYMNALAKNMGLNVQALIDGYKGFAASAAFAGVSQENINRQMVAFTKAAAALAMSAEDTKLMFNALAQMYSKNKVSAEELRGQLGERLPGAMELLAKSMKVPVEALDELMKKGQIITKEVMPAFAKEVEIAFGIAADKTDTFTAAFNRLFSELEVAIVRIMEGGIGDFIKGLLNRLAAISELVKFFNQNAFQNELDYQNKRKVEVEKNVLYEIEQYRELYQKRTGLQLTADEAANEMLKDQKIGAASHFKFQQDEFEKLKESQDSYLDKTLRTGKKLAGAMGEMAASPINTLKMLGKDIFSPQKNSRLGEYLMESLKNQTDAINKSAIQDIEASQARYEKLKYFADNWSQFQKEKSEEDAEKENKATKNRYLRELQMLELQERIRRLYAEASINDEHKRSQEMIRIGIEFNNKKADVDQKYNKKSLANESQTMLDLRELTQNNYDLRLAETSAFRSQIKRNDDKYYKEGYDAAVKYFDKIQDWRKKQEEKTIDLEEKENRRVLSIGKNRLQAKLENDRLSGKIELQNLEQSFDEKIKEAEKQKTKEQTNDKLNSDAKKEIQTKYYNEIIALINAKSRATTAVKKEWGNKDVENQAAIDRELFKQRAKAIKEFIDRDAYRLETAQLHEKNAYRDRKANYREEEELDTKHQLQIVDNKIKANQDIIKNNEDFLNTQKDLTEEEKTDLKNANNALNDEIERAYEERNQIALNSRDKRMAYEQEVFKQSVNLAQEIVNGLFDLQQEAFSNQLAALQYQSDEQVRLADGNQQKIDIINQERRNKEREIKRKQFKAEQAAAVAQVLFNTAPIIAQYLAKPPTIPLGILAGFTAAAQIGFILAKSPPEYAKGTRGKKHKGGPAIVGEIGVEKVITESGKVYYTPPTATLLDLPKGSQVIPNNELTKKDIYYASNLSGKYNQATGSGNIERKLDEIGKILSGLPIHQVSMDERGFEKFIRTERRTTKILNNRFGKTK